MVEAGVETGSGLSTEDGEYPIVGDRRIKMSSLGRVALFKVDVGGMAAVALFLNLPVVEACLGGA